MIAYRTTWIVKQGRMEEALELLRAESDWGFEQFASLPESTAVRVYTPDLSPNVLIYENAFDSVEDHDQFWAEYNGTPQAAAFWPKWAELMERRVSDERWHLAEWRN